MSWNIGNDLFKSRHFENLHVTYENRWDIATRRTVSSTSGLRPPCCFDLISNIFAVSLSYAYVLFSEHFAQNMMTGKFSGLYPSRCNGAILPFPQHSGVCLSPLVMIILLENCI